MTFPSTLAAYKLSRNVALSQRFAWSARKAAFCISTLWLPFNGALSIQACKLQASETRKVFCKLTTEVCAVVRLRRKKQKTASDSSKSMGPTRKLTDPILNSDANSSSGYSKAIRLSEFQIAPRI